MNNSSKRFLQWLGVVSLIFCLQSGRVAAQTYFPPTSGNQWDTLAPGNLGWCQDSINALYSYLGSKGTKSFIVLKDGKMVLEKYFGTYVQDSVWYWASAGKSLAAFLVGCAQEDNLLDINDRTDQHLGVGWTVAPPAKEALITLKNQLSMNTGLDENVPDQDCLADTCLMYLADAGTRWAYYNAPYRLLQDVLNNVTGQSMTVYTLSRLGSRIGMGGFWFNYVRWGKARDMARFGLLNLAEGVWDGDTILGDATYLNDMVNSSQQNNLSYGYLWWLNGKGSHMLPQTQAVIPFDLVPNAPADMYAALGKNDQKIYVVPSEGLVVVRQGESAGNSAFALSSFDNELWGKLSNLSCPVAVDAASAAGTLRVSPNPARENLRIDGLTSSHGPAMLRILNHNGQVVLEKALEAQSASLNLSLADLSAGLYFVEVREADRVRRVKFVRY